MQIVWQEKKRTLKNISESFNVVKLQKLKVSSLLLPHNKCKQIKRRSWLRLYKGQLRNPSKTGRNQSYSSSRFFCFSLVMRLLMRVLDKSFKLIFLLTSTGISLQTARELSTGMGWALPHGSFQEAQGIMQSSGKSCRLIIHINLIIHTAGERTLHILLTLLIFAMFFSKQSKTKTHQSPFLLEVAGQAVRKAQAQHKTTRVFLTAEFEAGRQQQCVLKNHAQRWKQQFHFLSFTDKRRHRPMQTSTCKHYQQLIYLPTTEGFRPFSEKGPT